MSNLPVITESDLELVYFRYFEIISDGLKNLHPARLRALLENGGKYCILRGLEDAPYFFAGLADESDEHLIPRDHVTAVEYFDAGRTLQELLEYLPHQLAFAAICTAGKIHKFRGGARAGAGRRPSHPVLKKVAVSVKLPRWLIDWLDQQAESRAVLIEDALRAKYNIEPPSYSANT